jgi:hypothetical protein
VEVILRAAEVERRKLCAPHSTVLKPVKMSSMIAINLRRRERGQPWQERFFDHALRTVRSYHQKVEYIHLKPVKRGPVQSPQEWKWSSMAEYAGVSGEEQEWEKPRTIEKQVRATTLRKPRKYA